MRTTESEQAFRAVLRDYEPLIRHIAGSLLPCARSTGALEMDDLLAEGRIALWEAVERFKTYKGEMPENRFYGLRIRHRMIDATRRCSAFTRKEVRTGVGGTPRVVALLDVDEQSSAPSQETAILAREVMKRVDRLSARVRSVVILCDVAGWRGQEVAEDMGVSESRICQLHKAGIAQVRQELECGEAA